MKNKKRGIMKYNVTITLESNSETEAQEVANGLQRYARKLDCGTLLKLLKLIDGKPMLVQMAKAL